MRPREASALYPIIKGGERKNYRRCDVTSSFRDTLDKLVNERIAQGADPRDLFEELSREANHVFGQFNLEYELGLTKKEGATD